MSELIGAGGMGAVWKATDTKLHRDVAIKTIADMLGRRKDPLGFEREARLLASLNHPNIGTIHGFEEHQGMRFLVLEFVDGETLEERLRREAIPLEEALRLARQVSEALDAAHQKGIIHRDLKVQRANRGMPGARPRLTSRWMMFWNFRPGRARTWWGSTTH
ncbi:MAG TPA: serine/threonine-protein kinase [Terriglobia bacterium]|nr:serine/threonine-protein kinase [Terriglobia bacterium]